MNTVSLFVTISAQIIAIIAYICSRDLWRFYKTIYGVEAVKPSSTNNVAKLAVAVYGYTKLLIILFTTYHVYVAYQYFN